MLISRVTELGRVVGVQRGEHQVAGQGGLHGDVGRLGVADFAEHDHVRVLPQQGAQGGGEGHADLVVDLDLVDEGQVVFDRVFDRADVHFVPSMQRRHGVERGGFARAGGPGDQDDAVGLVDLLAEDRSACPRRSPVVPGPA